MYYFTFIDFEQKLSVLCIQQNCLVGIYLICTLATSMLSLMVSILTLRLFHHDGREPIPNWLRTTIRFMATVTCQGREKKLFNKNLWRRIVPEVRPEMVPEVAPAVEEKTVLDEKKTAEVKHGIAKGNLSSETIKDEQMNLSGSSSVGDQRKDI